MESETAAYPFSAVCGRVFSLVLDLILFLLILPFVPLERERTFVKSRFVLLQQTVGKVSCLLSYGGYRLLNLFSLFSRPCVPASLSYRKRVLRPPLQVWPPFPRPFQGIALSA